MPNKGLSYFKSQRKRNLRHKAKKERDGKCDVGKIPDETLESLRGIYREQINQNTGRQRTFRKLFFIY